MALIDSLVSYYELEDATDSHGAFSLTNNGSTGFSTGKIGNGANFTNTNSKYLYLNSATPLGLAKNATVSFSFWFKIASETTADDDLFCVNWSGSGGIQLRGLYEYAGGTRRLRFYKIGATNTFLDITGNVGDNTWRHIAFTYNSGTGAMNLYLNAGTPVTGTNTGTTSPGGTAGFDIGDTRLSGYTAGLNGMIDEFGVWSKELTASEVAELYNSGAGLAYPFGGGGGYRFNPQIKPFAGL